MLILVGGASGFLGSALVESLRSEGHAVTRLVRGEANKPDESSWDPAGGVVDRDVVERADVVVSLSGAPIARWPWTASYRQELLDSRLAPTHTLASAIAETGAHQAFLSGSAMAYYGDDRGEDPLPETAEAGEGFLAHIVAEWEAAARPAIETGARVAFLRTSNVLHPDGGALRPLLRLFRLGLGGRLGDGKQYFPIISRDDWVRATTHLATHEDAEGPHNLAIPIPCTNAEFTKALAQAVHRPAVARVPRIALTTVLGDMGRALSGSLRLLPARLEEERFEFAHRAVGDVLAATLATRQ